MFYCVRCVSLALSVSAFFVSSKHAVEEAPTLVFLCNFRESTCSSVAKDVQTFGRNHCFPGATLPEILENGFVRMVSDFGFCVLLLTFQKKQT